MKGLVKTLPNTDESARSASKNSATVAGENMRPAIYPNGLFSNTSPLLDDSALGSTVQATASLQYYNAPYYHLTPPAMLDPDSFVNLGSMIAPELPLRREHAASPAIQRLLLKIREKRIHRESQNTSTDSSDFASHKLLSAAKAVSHRRLSSTSHIIKSSTEELAVADSHVPGLSRDPERVSIQADRRRSQSGHDTAMPLQSFPVRTPTNPDYFVHYGRKSPNVRQICPRPNTEPERTSTTAVSIDPQSCGNLEVFASPACNTYASSTSVSPAGDFAWSPQQTYGTPASSELNNTSKNNTPVPVIGEQTGMFLTENTGQNGIPSPSSRPKKRKLSHGEGLLKECESSPVIPIDVKSASRSEGRRRKHEREASARYRQKKKTKRSAEPPKEVDMSILISTASPNAKECGTHGSMNLAPPTSTEMTLSSSQQSYSSILSGSTQVSTSSGSTNMASRGIQGDGWPDLPELHPYERRRKINYGPLAPYGSAETIKSYPPSFQASLHRVVDFQKIEWLKLESRRVLFVYGSLMMSDLWHDVFEKTSEWIFHSEIVKKCMCPAKVPGYSRFSVQGSDEPVMMKAEKGASVSTHGMLIFGLTDENFRVLDRYLADGFVQEEVSAYVNLKSSSTNFQVSTYVWPRETTAQQFNEGRGRGKTIRIDQDVEWTVARFWAESRLCRIWREAVVEQERLLAKAAERHSMAIHNS